MFYFWGLSRLRMSHTPACKVDLGKENKDDRSLTNERVGAWQAVTTNLQFRQGILKVFQKVHQSGGTN